MMRWQVAIIALMLAAPAFSRASDDMPVIYSRAVIKIVPADTGAPEAKPKAKTEDAEGDDSKPEENKPTSVLPHLQRVAKEFTVEVRPLRFLSQRDFISHQPFTDTGGMLILIDPPARMALKSASLLAKLDVLFVNSDGVITKIAPGISLAYLDEDIDSGKAIRAFIFLKSGMASASDIHPDDHVEGSFFRTHPVILQ